MTAETRNRRVRLAALIAAVAAGLLYGVALLGPGPIDPTNTAWIFGDNATYYFGWAQYRHDPHLHFPLAWTERVGYPVGTSIALLDAIPLIAILLRPLSPLLPEPFQYLGPYAVLCFVLQAYFGFRLCSRLFPGRPLSSLLGAVLLLVSAPLTWRAFGHTSLLSHWLLLAAFDSYFRDPGDRPVRWLARLWVVVVLGAAITPYLGVMCCLCALAGAGRLGVERRVTWSRTALLGAATFGVLLATGLVVGVIGVRDGPTYWAPGFGLYSLNLNSLVNPMQYGSLLLPPLPVMGPEQIEGYDYLGLGVLVLLVLGLVRRPGAVLRLGQRRLIPLAVLALVCTLFAVSSTVTLGTRMLLEIDLSPTIGSLAQGLRASARFFWPAYYLIVAAAITLTVRAWGRRASVTILACAAALQVADLTPLRHQVRTMTNQRFPSELTSPEWAGLGERVDTLVLLPPFQCQPFTGVGGFYSFVTFGKLAAVEKLRANSYYAARYSQSDRYAHCVDLMRAELAGALDPRTAYVVTDSVRTVWALAGLRSHVCRRANGYNLCTPRAPDDSSPAMVAPEAPPYTLGDELNFSASGGAEQYRVHGWLPALAEGSWTDGPLALVRLRPADPLDPARALVLEVAGRIFAVHGHPRLTIDVAVNGHTIDRWIIRTGVPIRRKARISGDIATARRGLDIELRVADPAAQLYLDAGPSSDFIGINVHRLVVRPE